MERSNCHPRLFRASGHQIGQNNLERPIPRAESYPNICFLVHSHSPGARHPGDAQEDPTCTSQMRRGALWQHHVDHHSVTARRAHHRPPGLAPRLLQIAPRPAPCPCRVLCPLHPVLEQPCPSQLQLLAALELLLLSCSLLLFLSSSLQPLSTSKRFLVLLNHFHQVLVVQSDLLHVRQASPRQTSTRLEVTNHQLIGLSLLPWINSSHLALHALKAP